MIINRMVAKWLMWMMIDGMEWWQNDDGGEIMIDGVKWWQDDDGGEIEWSDDKMMMVAK